MNTCTFAKTFGQDSYLRFSQTPAGHVERSHVFLAFAAALRDGVLSGGRSPFRGDDRENTSRVRPASSWNNEALLTLGAEIQGTQESTAGWVSS